MKKVILKIEGMTCSACSSSLEKYLLKQNGIDDALVNLVMSSASISYEDNITLDDLSKYFDSTVIEALRVLTKKNDDNYEEYIKRVKTNEIATIVKLKDLEHNMDLTRLDEVTEDDIRRKEKYEDAISYLEMVELI